MPTRYDKEFKQNIINLYKQGESAAQLAREYGIGYSTVHKWIQGQAKTKSGKSPDEIKAMEKQLASLSEENEILKKALGFHIIKMIGTDFICLMKKLNTMWVATP